MTISRWRQLFLWAKFWCYFDWNSRKNPIKIPQNSTHKCSCLCFLWIWLHHDLSSGFLWRRINWGIFLLVRLILHFLLFDFQAGSQKVPKSAKLFRSLEQFIRTVKGQNNFCNRMLIPGGFLDLIHYKQLEFKLKKKNDWLLENGIMLPKLFWPTVRKIVLEFE